MQSKLFFIGKSFSPRARSPFLSSSRLRYFYSSARVLLPYAAHCSYSLGQHDRRRFLCRETRFCRHLQDEMAVTGAVHDFIYVRVWVSKGIHWKKAQ